MPRKARDRAKKSRVSVKNLRHQVLSSINKKLLHMKSNPPGEAHEIVRKLSA